MKINKKGFTLIELLVTIVIIGLVVGLSTYGIIKVVSSSKNKSTVLTTANIKESARTYSSEASSDTWKEGKDYQSFCVTIGELINKGLLDKKATILEELSRDTFVIVNRDKVTLSIVEEEVIMTNDNNYRICTGEVTTDEEVITKYPKVGTSISYTDQIVINFEKGSATYLDTPSETNYTCLYGKSSSLINKEGKIEGNKCILEGLNNNKDYYVLIYMNTNHGSSVVAEGTKEFYTSNFNKPNITQNSNVVTISYNDKDSNGNNVNSPSHYFKSEINGTSNIDVEKCEQKDNIFTCSGTSSNIEKDIWYKVSSSTVNITYPEKNSNFNVSARIQDGSNNYMTNDKNIIINKYVVKFYKNTASIIDGSTSEYIEKSCINGENKPCNITSPTITAKTGYSTVGWNTSSTASTSSWTADAVKSISASANYYAITKINTYTLKYDATGGSVNPTSKSLNYGAAYGTLPTPTRTGYTFDGWYTSETGGTKVNVDDKIGAGDITIYAHWTINTYTVTFVDGLGNTLKTQTVNHGGNATAPSTPTRTGYKFNGWSGTYTNVTNNRTITATWEANTYKVSYNANGGLGAPSNQTKTYGVNLTLSSTRPTRSGYTFLGWSTLSSAITVSYDSGATYTSNSNLTLYAVWGAYKYVNVNVSLNCRASASTGASLVTTFGCGKQVLAILTSTAIDSYFWHYVPDYSCYSSGQYLQNTKPTCSSGGSGGSTGGQNPCTCNTDLDCGTMNGMLPSCKGGQCWWCVKGTSDCTTALVC